MFVQNGPWFGWANIREVLRSLASESRCAHMMSSITNLRRYNHEELDEAIKMHAANSEQKPSPPSSSSSGDASMQDCYSRCCSGADEDWKRKYVACSILRMSKHAACTSDDECMSKHARSANDGNGRTAPSPLADQGAWCILEQFLTTDMTYPQMDEAFSSYLGDRYVADDWKDARNAKPLHLKARHMPLPPSSSRMNGHLSSTPVQRSHQRPKSRTNSSTHIKQSCKPLRSNPYIITEVDEKEEDEEDEEGEEGEEDEEGPSVRLPTATHLSGPSAKDRLAAAFDNIYDRIQENPPSSSEGRHARHCKAASFPRAIEGRMYLLHIQRNGADYIAEHLWIQGFLVTVSGWVAGQLYVVADSPRTIAASLPPSHKEERQAVEHSHSKLPNPGWVRIKYGKYKGDIGYVFDSDQSNGLVSILIALRDFPYPMPGGSVALLDRCLLPNDQAVCDILCDGKVVGCSYRGEQYYMGLLVKIFHRDRLEIVASPHADDIKLHIQSAWDTPFVRKTLFAFSMQFLHTGDLVRIIAGEIRSEIGTVILTDHASGSDLEHIFHVGDEIRVVAGPYLGLEGHIIQISDDMFHICQAVSKEEVLVSRYYLDRRPLHHVFHPQLPMPQRFEPPPQSESIQVGDHIEVLAGEHWKKCGIVEWFPTGSAMLWFRDTDPMLAGDDVGTSVGPSRIRVPVAVVQRTKLPDTLKYTQERGYNVRPGDVVSVAHGSEYQRKGVVQNVDFPNACLTFLSDSDHSLVCNVTLDSFDNIISQEVFIVGGDRKGYRATLYSIASDTCTVTVHGQARMTLACDDVVTSYGMRMNGAILEGPDLVSFCKIRKSSYITTMQPRSITPPPVQLPASSSTSVVSSLSSWASWTADPENPAHHESSSITPSSSTLDPWTVNPQDAQDVIDTRVDKLTDSGPLPWLMGKEYSSVLLLHPAVLKVALVLTPSSVRMDPHLKIVSLYSAHPVMQGLHFNTTTFPPRI
ncbi:hypothetical protein DFH29DRAFT_883868 [Suillus ampliporus]|nr:hypothetical protein DFH29DRAFT_883868 [Suillus ampliporus]